MKSWSVLGFAALALGATGRLTTRNDCHKIQYDFASSPAVNTTDKAEAVKQAYVDIWDDYASHAFGADGYNPVGKVGSNGSGSWGLFMIDGIDTAMVMGLKDIVDKQLEHIAAQDFNATADPQIDGFDTIIRLIGGLLSAYDLVTSGLIPFADQYDKGQVSKLLHGARVLADFLSPIYDTPTGLPLFWINTTTRVGFPGFFDNTAVDGTIILEYHRLTDLTNDTKYRDQADKAESYLLNPNPVPIYPALVGSNINLTTGEFTNQNTGWQSGLDSFFEYLIKSVVYDPTQPLAQDYQQFWTTAVESTQAHLISHPYGHDELTFVTTLNNTGTLQYEMDDYSCFAGGNWLLGGVYLGRQDFIDLGLALTDSCHVLYNTTASGLNPLTIGWYGPDNLAYEEQYNNGSLAAQQARAEFNERGYFIRQDSYGLLNTLYPEPIESNMYAWRITGDTRWQDHNWEIFQAMQKAGNRPPVPIASLFNVSAPDGGDYFPDVPSYYLAETLKYFYLTFSDTNLVNLEDFVFNTEGHPFRVQSGTCSTP